MATQNNFFNKFNGKLLMLIKPVHQVLRFDAFQSTDCIRFSSHEVSTEYTVFKPLKNLYVRVASIFPQLNSVLSSCILGVCFSAPLELSAIHFSEDGVFNIQKIHISYTLVFYLSENPGTSRRTEQLWRLCACTSDRVYYYLLSAVIITMCMLISFK